MPRTCVITRCARAACSSCARCRCQATARVAARRPTSIATVAATAARHSVARPKWLIATVRARRARVTVPVNARAHARPCIAAAMRATIICSSACVSQRRRTAPDLQPRLAPVTVASTDLVKAAGEDNALVALTVVSKGSITVSVFFHVELVSASAPAWKCVGVDVLVVRHLCQWDRSVRTYRCLWFQPEQEVS